MLPQSFRVHKGPNSLFWAFTAIGLYSFLILQELERDIHSRSRFTSDGIGDHEHTMTHVKRAQLESFNFSRETPREMSLTSTARRLYPCKNEQEAKWSASCYLNNTVTIGLTVWKRASLARQLDEAAEQSLRPSQILVVQSKNFVDAKSIIEEWKKKNPDVPVHLIRVSADSGYHSRFHVAYMLSKTEYISIWDDDVIAGSDWIKESILQSKMHNDALMGGMGRCILSLPDQTRKTSVAAQKPQPGQNDFVGHTWTLKRDHLRHYFAFLPFTYVTGEDMQLAFALQINGIDSRMTHQHGNVTLKDDVTLRKDENASFLKKDKNLVRTLLICQIIRAGFRTLRCDNCEPKVADECIRDFRSRVEEMGFGEDV